MVPKKASEQLADVLSNAVSLLKSTNLFVNGCWSCSLRQTYWLC